MKNHIKPILNKNAGGLILDNENTWNIERQGKGLDSQEREVTNRDATHLKMYPVVKLK